MLNLRERNKRKQDSQLKKALKIATLAGITLATVAIAKNKIPKLLKKKTDQAGLKTIIQDIPNNSKQPLTYNLLKAAEDIEARKTIDNIKNISVGVKKTVNIQNKTGVNVKGYTRRSKSGRISFVNNYISKRYKKVNNTGITDLTGKKLDDVISIKNNSFIDDLNQNRRKPYTQKELASLENSQNSLNSQLDNIEEEAKSFGNRLRSVISNTELTPTRRDMELFKIIDNELPERSIVLKFKDITEAVINPTNIKNGRLKKYDNVLDFLNQNATDKYKGKIDNYVSYVVKDTFDSNDDYLQFLNRINKATKEPTSNLYERITRNYRNKLINEGLDIDVATKQANQFVTDIYKNKTEYLEELKKNIDNEIERVRNGDVFIRDGKIVRQLGLTRPERRASKVVTSNFIEPESYKGYFGKSLIDREKLKEQFLEGLYKGTERRVIKESLTNMLRGTVRNDTIDIAVDILADLDTEAVRIKDIVNQILDIPKIFEDGIEKYGGQQMSRRIFLQSSTEATKDLFKELIERQTKTIAKDPKRFTAEGGRIVEYVDNEVRLRILQSVHKPEIGWLVKKDFIARLLNPFGSKYDAKTSLEIAERLGRSQRPIREFFWQKGLKNPFSIRTKMERMFNSQNK